MLKSLIPFLIDRLAGSQKAAVSSGVGGTALAATAAFNPGDMVFPGNPEYAMALNALAYLVGLALVAYRERKEGKA